jgi:energy-converting hydrogenase A subunit F
MSNKKTPREGHGTIIHRISREISDFDNLVPLYALLIVVTAIAGLVTLPLLTYEQDQLYPKNIVPTSPLNPYDRGGTPFNSTVIIAQYPENSPYMGYVTTYLTPLSRFMAQKTLYMGTTIPAHPGGIIDEILYYTRGIDTIVETSILFVAFATASYLFRRREE